MNGFGCTTGDTLHAVIVRRRSDRMSVVIAVSALSAMRRRAWPQPSRSFPVESQR